jgi:hypothetical protein
VSDASENTGPFPQSRIDVVKCLLVAVVLASGYYALGGNRGFDMADTGFLWYGVQRTALGEVPIRDFASYDPGRYYGLAALVQLQGDDGFLALRRAQAVFHGFALAATLMLISGVGGRGHSLPWLVLWGCIIVWWIPVYAGMTPVWVVVSLTWLVAQPDRRWRHFLAGVVIGAAAFVGRNHGVYGVLGYVVLSTSQWLGGSAVWRWPVAWRGALSAAGGVVIGYLPMIALIVFSPGFSARFWDSIIHILFEVKTAHLLPLPTPWPWQAGLKGGLRDIPIQYAIGLVFLGLSVLGWSSWFLLAAKARRAWLWPPVVLGALAMVPGYAHYAFTRADVAHLSGGIQPALIVFAVACTLLRPARAWFGASVALGVTVVVGSSYQPAVISRIYGWQDWVEVGADRVLMSRETARLVGWSLQVHRDLAEPERSFLALPYSIGLHAMTKTQCPIHEIYPLLPRTKAFQESEIERLRADPPSFVILEDKALDGKEELRFQNTFPILHAYIYENFDFVSRPELPAHIQVLKPRPAEQPLGQAGSP